MISLLSILFTFGILIFVHELGHFIACRLTKVKVEVFSLGFGPKLISKKHKDTIYQIALIPFGGYVKPAGENIENLTNASNELPSKSKIQQIFVYISGALMNIILGYLIYSFIFIKGVEIPASYNTNEIGYIKTNSIIEKSGLQIKDKIITINGNKIEKWIDIKKSILLSGKKGLHFKISRENQYLEKTISFEKNMDLNRLCEEEIGPYVSAKIGSIKPNTPAEKTGLMPKDIIVKINNQKITQWYQIAEITHKNLNKELTFVIKRQNNFLEKIIIPEVCVVDNQKIGIIGISPETIIKKYGFGKAMIESGKSIFQLSKMTYIGIGKLIAGEVSFKSVSGPIGISRIIGEQAKQGFANLFNILAFISISLAIFNLLPIPLVDGGQIVILIIEGIIRKDFSLKTKNIIQQIGVYLLISLAVIVSWNDFLNLLFKK